MKKKVLSILFVLVLVCSFSLVTAAPVAAATPIYVDATGDDTKDGQTPKNAVQTISKGIELVDTGGTVNVAVGTYEEAVVIDKSLTLQGEDRETTELKFGYGAYPSLPPLIISADEVTVSGFTIRSGPRIEAAFGVPSGWAFTIIVDGDSALLTDLHVIKDPLLYRTGGSRTGGSAFWLAPGLDGFTLTDSIVDSAWNGIYAREDGSDITVLNVDFTYLGTYAIMLKQITGATIEGNIFTNTGNELGLLVSRGCEGIEITDNKFVGSGSSESSHIGILLQDFKTGPVGVSILGNDISDFDRGIKVEANVETSGIHINYNSITGDTYSVENLALTTVDATLNWWGDDQGPEHTSNPRTTNGDSVSDNVIFLPWLGAPYPDGQVCNAAQNEGTSEWYFTIQSAINAADTGDTVNVAAGTYYEHILIDEALTVRSTDGAKVTIIDSNGYRYKVTIEHSDVTLEGFTVTDPNFATGADATGILIHAYYDEDVSNVQILDNIITQVRSETGTPSTFGSVGINIGYAKTKGNTLSDIVISGNTITDIKNPEGGASDHTCGINVWDGAENVLISNNDISDIKFNGIILERASNVRIEGNSITECKVGIRVQPFEEGDVSGLTVNFNNIAGNTEYGVANFDLALSVDATHNWWGNERGPSRAMGKAKGHDEVKGDRVSPNVIFAPWLRASVEP